MIYSVEQSGLFAEIHGLYADFKQSELTVKKQQKKTMFDV